jgi:hypothetical protein
LADLKAVMTLKAAARQQSTDSTYRWDYSKAASLGVCTATYLRVFARDY